MIRFRALTRRVGDKDVLGGGIDFTVERGARVALRGPNGPARARSCARRRDAGDDGIPLWPSLTVELWLRHREGRPPALG